MLWRWSGFVTIDGVVHDVQAGYHVIFLHRARSIQPFAADSGEARAAALARLGAQQGSSYDSQSFSPRVDV